MLSFRARGILAYLQANPDAPVNTNHLYGVGAEGYEATRTALHELVDAGYLTVATHTSLGTGRIVRRHHRTRALAEFNHGA